ncbi:MAG TPA: hypothetical protein VNM37_16505, partial [Candidatus Dormibacteraeota bacterium]|nr:hypothetical protein [Candidatus Dormibacteraeota bacterium]
RYVMAGATAFLAFLGIAAIASSVTLMGAANDKEARSWASSLFGMFIIGAAASTWAANLLRSHRPTR